MLGNITHFAIWMAVGFVAILTIFCNLYILLMNIGSYHKNHRFQPSEIIITVLSVTNIVYQILTYLWMTMDLLSVTCLIDGLFNTLIMLLINSLRCTLVWTTAFLSFFYSIKLVIEPIHCYTKIQEGILKHAPTVLLVIVFFSFASCFPAILVLSRNNQTGSYDCNTMICNETPGLIYVGFYTVISDIIPGLIMMKSSISITVHLAIHLHHMKANTNSSHGPKLGSQMRVIRMIMALMVVYLCFLIADLVVLYRSTINRDNLSYTTGLVSSIYTSTSSFILIYGKKVHWKELIHIYNQFVGEYPCICCMRCPEKKVSPPH
ncbi:UNVERIFIED_CONTAM: hypothetical protein FKN15_039789 [Acipenser sinensis]